jgi:hypothetical protein
MPLIDPILSLYEERWAQAAWKDRARILRAYVLYCKQRYGDIEARAPWIESHLIELEGIVEKLDDIDEFLHVSSAIGYVRGRIKERGAKFAGRIVSGGKQTASDPRVDSADGGVTDLFIGGMEYD